MRKKKFRVATVYLLVFVILCSFIVMPCTAGATGVKDYNFESCETGTQPEGLECMAEDGEVSVESYYGKKILSAKTDTDGKMTMVSGKFDEVSNTVLKATFGYMQRYEKTDESVVFALRSGTKEIIKFITRDGNIVSLGSDSSETVIVEDYNANNRYDFEVTANLSQGTFDVTVAENTKKSLKFYNNSAKCDGFAFYTKYAPGFALFHIGFEIVDSAAYVEIDGSDNISVLNESENQFDYTAVMYDDFGNEVSGAQYAWSIEPADIDGIAITENNDTMTVTVSPDTVYRGVVTIKVTATSAGGTVSNFKYATVITQQAAELEFEGPRKIAYNINNDNEFELNTVLKNADGEVLDNEAVEWSIVNNLDDVEITKTDTSLLIHVGGELPNRGKIEIKATLKSNSAITATRTIYTYPTQVYKSDEARFETMTNSLDYLVNDAAKNPCNDTPLLSCFVDMSTMKATPYETAWNGTYYASNLAQVSGLYRVLDGMSVITGDDTYSDFTDSTYQWYIDNGLADNNLGYWGGHAVINMDTQKFVKSASASTPYENDEGIMVYPEGKANAYNYHELKDYGFYWEPFFRADKEKGSDIVKALWFGHISDWTTLNSNRHGSYSKDFSGQLSIWETSEQYECPTEFVHTTLDMPFRSFVNDLINAAGVMYKETGDTDALNWGYNYLKNYYTFTNPDTDLIAPYFITGHGPNAKNPDVEYPNWWLTTDRDHPAGGTLYGDRFYNQFAVDLVDQGFYPESALENYDQRCTETNLAGLMPSDDFEFAKLLGEDSEAGKDVMTRSVKNNASYIRLAWIKNTTTFHSLMRDGVIIDDFIPKRNGYMGVQYVGSNTRYGTVGRSGVDTFETLCATHSAAVKLGMTEDADTVKEVLDFYSKSVYDIGILGDNEIGDEGTKLNLATTNSSLKLMMAVLSLYETCGNEDFLELARAIAANYYKNNMSNGLLYCTDSNYNSTKPGTGIGETTLYMVGGYNYVGYYALMKLEAILSGVSDEVPAFRDYDGFYCDYFIDEYQDKWSMPTERDWIQSHTNSGVKIKKIVAPSEITLKRGESKELVLTYLPEDHTEGAGLTYAMSEKGIVSVNDETMTLTGVKSGEMTLTVYAGSDKIKKTIKITVE